MKSRPWINGLCAVLALLYCASAAPAEPLRIFAAASLQGPLDEIADSYPPGARISYGGSGAIARQVSLGAPADVVILANADWMAWLGDRVPLAARPRDILGNRLVLVGPPGAVPLDRVTPEALVDRLGGGRLAMGQHQSVPAGIYGQQWLAHVGAWEALRPQLAETENVRAALTLLTRGEVPLALVYASDAQAAGDAVALVHAVPQAAHDPIRYPAAAVTEAGIPFLAHLRNNLAAFTAAGFEALP